MKTERRHELHSNWLADHVEDLLVQVRPYSKAICGVVLAAAVLLAAYLFMQHRAQAEEARSWNTLWNGMLGGMGGQETLESLADSSSKQPTTDWARLLLADGSLGSGENSWFVEKAVARNLLNTALENYQAVLKNSTDPLLREHALYGVGRANEALCKIDEARTAYQQLVKDYPNGSYAARAKGRLESLSRDSTLARYDWFAKVEPPPNVSSKSGDNKLDDSGLSLPSDLEPLSQFSSKPSTPPPAPTPDLGPSAPKSGTSATKPLGDGTLLKLPPAGAPKVEANPALTIPLPAANKPAPNTPAGAKSSAAPAKSGGASQTAPAAPSGQKQQP